LEPRVLIADEPLANLDLEVRPVVFDAITRRRTEQSMAALLVTNDAAFIRELDAEALMLRGGHVVARGIGRNLAWAPNAEADAARGTRHARGAAPVRSTPRSLLSLSSCPPAGNMILGSSIGRAAGC